MPFLDLSTGINAVSYPLSPLPATTLTRLPEPERLKELTALAARTYGAPGASHLCAAPGTQILLPAVMRLVSEGPAAILGPTYAEHARCAALSGRTVAETSDLEALGEARIAVVVNPNNPDGRLVGRGALLKLADRLAARGGLLVVDEAFMDVTDETESVAGDAGRPGLLVLRSFGKFYGLAGVRLGFALGEPGLVARLDATFGPWAVSGPALEYGIAALGDDEWRRTTRARLAGDASRLDNLLERAGLPVAGGTPLFRLVRSTAAQAFHEALGQHGILVRRFGWNTDLLRFGLPGQEAEWQRLANALMSAKEEIWS